jgi:two-component system chemotaxis response regulator CheB
MKPRCELVVVGAADGGLTALSTILNALPAAFQVPILVALRTHPQSVQTLVRIMNGYSAVPVSYAGEGRFARLGHVYLPPAGVDLVMRPEGVMGLDERDSTPTGMRPIDRLLTSAAAVHGPRVIAVLLSGCDGEGMLGLRAVDEAGGVAVVEDRDANAPPSLLRSRQDLGQPSLHARLDGIAPLLARLADG